MTDFLFRKARKKINVKNLYIKKKLTVRFQRTRSYWPQDGVILADF